MKLYKYALLADGKTLLVSKDEVIKSGGNFYIKDFDGSINICRGSLEEEKLNKVINNLEFKVLASDNEMIAIHDTNTWGYSVEIRGDVVYYSTKEEAKGTIQSLLASEHIRCTDRMLKKLEQAKDEIYKVRENIYKDKTEWIAKDTQEDRILDYWR